MSKNTAVDRYKELREEADKLKEKIARDRGRAEGIKESLMTEFGCKSIEEAEELVEAMRKTLKEKNDEVERLCDEFESKWGDKIGS